VALEIIGTVRPVAFGGPFYAFYDSPKPRWFKDSYGSYEPGTEPRFLKGDEAASIYGGNSFFRRDVLEKIGGFDSSLGMTGGKISYGEETAVLKAIAAAMPGEVIYYHPRLAVYHLVPARKMTIRWIIKSGFASGRMYYRVFKANEQWPGRQMLLREAYRSCKALATVAAASVYGRDRDRYPYPQNYIYEQSYGLALRLGTVCEQYRDGKTRRLLASRSLAESHSGNRGQS
jgi:hypothetical protein